MLTVGACLVPLSGLVTDPTSRVSVIVVVGAGVAVTTVFMLLGLLPERFRTFGLAGIFADLMSISRYMLHRPAIAIRMLALSIVIQLLAIGALVILFHNFGAPVDYVTCFVLGVPVMLIAMLPISIAGWGMREGAMVVAFGLIGIPAPIVLAVSVGFGLGLLLTALPGGLVWLALVRSTRSSIED